MVWDVAISIGMAGAAFIFIYLGVSLHKNHSVLQMFFILIGLITLVTLMASLGLIVQAATSVSFQTGISNTMFMLYSLFLWAFIFVVGYFMILFIYNWVKKRRLDREIK